MVNEIELLAPAKDLECGISAINCGADAVYIGAPKFGARESAGNSFEDIAELVKHAHTYWAKVYVTLNTILTDEELPSAVRMISRLYELGIDGLIIQDVGLLECDLPPVPIIASTQMHNNTPEKVNFLEQVGIKRVILARELDLDQIRDIREQTGVELEFFVHGALCVCYSGQCYLSYALGGRSGNRGQCAQPCRKHYKLVDKSGKTLAEKHLLSLRDLNLSEDLTELIRAGICSFKIEGRLKDKAYVSNVVAYYNQKLNSILPELGLKRSSSGKSRIDFTPDPAKTFNRGYTSYFVHGKGAKVGSIETPKMVGEPVGQVISVGKRSVQIDTKLVLNRGDGICFFDRKGELRGSTINDASGNTVVPDKPEGIEKGTLIYRNHDHEFIARLNKTKPERQIDVLLSLSESADGFNLSATDEDQNKAGFTLKCEKIPANKPEQALENIRKQLSKSGDTEFSCGSVDIDLATAYFLPISMLNTLRRGVLEQLSKVRQENRPVKPGSITKKDFPYPANELSYFGNVLNSKAEEFYRRHGVTKIQPAAESGLVDLRGHRVMTTRYCIKHQLGTCPRDGRDKSSDEPLHLVDAEGHKLELRFDCTKCEMLVYLAGE